MSSIYLDVDPIIVSADCSNLDKNMNCCGTFGTSETPFSKANTESDPRSKVAPQNIEELNALEKKSNR